MPLTKASHDTSLMMKNGSMKRYERRKKNSQSPWLTAECWVNVCLLSNQFYQGRNYYCRTKKREKSKSLKILPTFVAAAWLDLNYIFLLLYWRRNHPLKISKFPLYTSRTTYNKHNISQQDNDEPATWKFKLVVMLNEIKNRVSQQVENEMIFTCLKPEEVVQAIPTFS